MKDRPVLDYSLGFIYEAFNELSTSRPFSQAGPLPIPLSELLAYCQFFEIHDLDFRSVLLKLVRRMDAEYITAVHGGPKPD